MLGKHIDSKMPGKQKESKIPGKQKDSKMPGNGSGISGKKSCGGDERIMRPSGFLWGKRWEDFWSVLLQIENENFFQLIYARKYSAPP